MTSRKKSVGIVLFNKTAAGLVVILQIRGTWNAEKNCPESWPGGCQVTAHGKLESGEDFTQALYREVAEELGAEILPAIKTLRLIELVNKNSSEEQIITYGAVVGEDIFKMLMSKPKSKTFGGFKLVRRNEIAKIVDLSNINKNIGATDQNTIAMFPDEKEAMCVAFEKLVDKV